MAGDALGVEVAGSDEGEQLTHVLAALFILEQIEQKNLSFTDALRAYTEKVRSSIG